MKVRTLAVVLFLSFVPPASAQTSNFSAKKTPKPVEIAAPAAAHLVGESLVYDVFWMGLHVGFGSLEVREITEVAGRRAYHVIAVAQTNDALSTMYPVRDEIHSYIDAETFHSLEFRKKLSERNYRADERITFDPVSKKGLYESFRNGEKKEVEIPWPVHDLVSAFYWFRLQPAKPGDKIKTRVSSEEKTYDLELDVMRQETKELRGGQVVDTLAVEPKTRLQGILYSRGRAWVHFTSDARRVPVLITLKTPFGPVVGALRPSSATKNSSSAN